MKMNDVSMPGQPGSNPAPAYRRPRKFPKFEVSRDFAAFAQGTSQYADELFEDASARDTALKDEGAEPVSSFEQTADEILTCIGTQGELREILYKILLFCRTSHRFCDVENYISGLDEVVYGHILQTPYSCIAILVHAGGLAKIALNALEEDVLSADLAGLTDDEIDDLIEDWRLETTEAGLYVTELLNPVRRLAAQLAVKPHRKSTYLRILEFCAEEPRSLDDIKQLFLQDNSLVLDYVTAHQKLSPDYYVDRLEKAGSLIWKGAWATTPEGLDFLGREIGA